MTVEPPNPYAPGAALGQDEARAEAQQRPKRWLAIVAALVAFPLGSGLYVLGRGRRFLGWALANLAAFALVLVGVRTGGVRLFGVGIAAGIVIWLGALIDAATAAPAATAPVFRRALLAVVLLFVAGRGVLAAARHWLLEGFSIPSAAMVPSLQVGDHIMVKKGKSGVTRGTPIVFQYPLDPSTSYIKRVIAMGGDVVQMRGDVVSVNGVELAQEKIGPCPPPNEYACNLLRETADGRSYEIMIDGPGRGDLSPVTVPPGHLFVLGDNRNNSSDSRVWGTVPESLVQGTAAFVYWPWSRIGKMP